MTLGQLVDWFERALMDGELAERDAKTLSSVIARLPGRKMGKQFVLHLNRGFG